MMLQHQPRFHRLELLEWALENERRISVDLYENEHDEPFAHALERGGGHMLVREPLRYRRRAPLGSGQRSCRELPSDRELIRAVLVARDGAVFVHRAADGIAIPRAHEPDHRSRSSPAAVRLWWCSSPLRTICTVPIQCVVLDRRADDQATPPAPLAVVARASRPRGSARRCSGRANYDAAARRGSSVGSRRSSSGAQMTGCLVGRRRAWRERDRSAVRRPRPRSVCDRRGRRGPRRGVRAA